MGCTRRVGHASPPCDAHRRPVGPRGLPAWLLSPPCRWEQPVASIQTPSLSGAVSGDKRRHQAASRASAAVSPGRICIHDQQTGHHCLRMGQSHAGVQPQCTSAAASTAAITMRRPSCWRVTNGVSAGGALLPRRSRSVGKVGNQSETTLRIKCLHGPGCRGAPAAAHQIQPPARPGQARYIRRMRDRRRRGQGGHSPACDGRVRFGQGRGQRPSETGATRMTVTPDPSAANCSLRDAVSPNRPTSPTTPARPGWRKASSITSNTAPTGFGEHHAVWMQPGRSQGGCKQIVPHQGPQDRTALPGQQTSQH